MATFGSAETNSIFFGTLYGTSPHRLQDVVVGELLARLLAALQDHVCLHALPDLVRNAVDRRLEHGWMLHRRGLRVLDLDTDVAVPTISGPPKRDHILIVYRRATRNEDDTFHEEQVPLITRNAGADATAEEAKSPYSFLRRPLQLPAQHVVDPVAVRPPRQGGLRSRRVGVRGKRGDHRRLPPGLRGGGGKVAGSVFPLFGTTEENQPFLSQIQDRKVEAVSALLPGADGKFVKQPADFGLKHSIPLLGSEFLTDEVILKTQGGSALGIGTSLRYTPRLHNPLNQEPVAAYEKRFRGVLSRSRCRHGWQCS